MASTFNVQKLDGDTATGKWTRKVDQYVLGLEERNIFERRSDSSVQSTTTLQQGEYLSLSTADEFGVLCRFR